MRRPRWSIGQPYKSESVPRARPALGKAVLTQTAGSIIGPPHIFRALSVTDPGTGHGHGPRRQAPAAIPYGVVDAHEISVAAHRPDVVEPRLRLDRRRHLRGHPQRDGGCNRFW